MDKVRTTTVESLLGILSLRPMSGYEIRQTMERSTANFWSESFGQIYPALKKLVTLGLAEMEESQPQGKRLQKVYRLTEAGSQRLRVWLDLPCEPQVKRNELLLKLFFGARSTPAAMCAQVEARRAALAASLVRYREIEARIPVLHAGNPGLPYFLMTVRYGIAETQALLGWCEETLAVLEAQGRAGRRPKGKQTQEA
jgi:PadR family transcriptional regulator AphA